MSTDEEGIQSRGPGDSKKLSKKSSIKEQKASLLSQGKQRSAVILRPPSNYQDEESTKRNQQVECLINIELPQHGFYRKSRSQEYLFKSFNKGKHGKQANINKEARVEYVPMANYQKGISHFKVKRQSKKSGSQHVPALLQIRRCNFDVEKTKQMLNSSTLLEHSLSIIRRHKESISRRNANLDESIRAQITLEQAENVHRNYAQTASNFVENTSYTPLQYQYLSIPEPTKIQQQMEICDKAQEIKDSFQNKEITHLSDYKLEDYKNNDELDGITFQQEEQLKEQDLLNFSISRQTLAASKAYRIKSAYGSVKRRQSIFETQKALASRQGTAQSHKRRCSQSNNTLEGTREIKRPQTQQMSGCKRQSLPLNHTYNFNQAQTTATLDSMSTSTKNTRFLFRDTLDQRRERLQNYIKGERNYKFNQTLSLLPVEDYWFDLTQIQSRDIQLKQQIKAKLNFLRSTYLTKRKSSNHSPSPSKSTTIYRDKSQEQKQSLTLPGKSEVCTSQVNKVTSGVQPIKKLDLSKILTKDKQ